MKERCDKGSPNLRPLELLKKPTELPFTNTENKAERIQKKKKSNFSIWPQTPFFQKYSLKNFN